MPEAYDLMDDYEAGEIALALEDRTPQEVLEWALDRFHPRLAISTSFQVDGMAILDMAWRINPGVRVFTVDTGRLPVETHDLIAVVRQRYDLTLEVLRPEPAELQSMTARHGPDLFYRDVKLRLLCCHVRKVAPLIKVLDGLDAWVTGLRRDQWASRSDIRKVELDHDHGGIVKVNPLADWSEAEVWEYVRAHEVPTHPLYARGYTSIGCAPCTRPTGPGEDARAGRWWWETNAPKECGMHCPVETGGFEHETEVLLKGRDP